VAPTHMCPLITNDDQNHFQYFRWGLIPFWAKDVKVGYKMINARIETIQTKSAFKRSLEKRRCIVPFDGFYEWKKTKDGKVPYRIKLMDDGIFTIAGLWEKWKSDNGEFIFSFTLITQEPNDTLAPIHDRMPAMLLKDQEKLWLDKDMPTEDALAMIKPFPDDLLKAYPVDKRVGKVSENDADLIKEVKVNTQGDLFS
ncbi:MAG: SOS response-associated peptidase, partial [Bacteroidota bacterium]